MRVLCVGRHPFLTEHLSRYFSELGAECLGVTGADGVVESATRFEPHVVVSDCDLLTAAMVDSWTREGTLSDTPVLAVSLTRRPEENGPPTLLGVAGVIYLPGLDREQARALLAAAYHPRGVAAPARMPMARVQSSAMLG